MNLKDSDAPHPHSVDDDRVVVVPVEVAHSNCISQVNVNRSSSQAGLNIYSKVLNLVVQKT